MALRWIGLGTTLILLGTPFVSAQSPPDSIQVEGVPEIPKALGDSLVQYQQGRTAQFQGWVGGGRAVLITTRFAETNQVHLIASPGGARRQLTFLSDRVLGASPRRDQAQFLFEADEGGAENYQLFLKDVQGGPPTRVSDGKARHVSARWSHSGRQLAWSSNARNGRDMDLYLVEPGKAEPSRRLKEVSGDWSVEDWSPDDTQVVASEYRSINESLVYIIDIKSGETTRVSPEPAKNEPTISHGEVRWSPDGKALFWTTDQGSEFRRLARFDLEKRTQATLTDQIPWNVEGFDLSDDGTTAVFTTNEDGLSRIHVLDLKTGKEQAVPELGAGQVGGLRFRPGSREFGFQMTSARATTDVYSYDLDQKTLTRWTESELGNLDPSGFAEPTLVRFSSFDGLSIPAFVYHAPARFKGPRPVLIHIHGGPESQFRPGFLGRLNYLIEELGITLVFPNVRGSAGYGKTYLRLDNGPKREDSVKDIGALLDWIGQQPNLDPKRVGVMGASYGGYMTLASLVHYSDRLKTGIDIIGISNFISFLENTQGYRRDLRRAEYGDERDPAMRAIFEQISPLFHAEKIKVPLMVAQGKNDPRVPAGESAQIVERVKSGGQPVWSLLGLNEGHGFAKKQNQDYLQAAEVLFLKTYLLEPGP